jgi:outer membrane protein TolC
LLPRRRAFVVVALASALAASFSSRASADPLRLEDAVRLALENNERARKAPLRVDVAEGQLDRARDAFFPTLTAQGAGTWNPNADPNARTPQKSITSSGTLVLNQPLLAPSAFPLYSQAKHNREAERWGAAQDKRQLAFDTAKAFLLTLSTERLLESAKRRLESATANQDNAQARAQAQLASVNDVTRAQIEVASAASSVAGAQGNVDRAYVALGFLVGQKLAPPLVPPDRTTKAAAAAEASTPAQLQAALERRPDLRSAHEKTQASQDFAREPLYRLAPTVGASAQVRADPDPVGTARAVDETVTLNLTWSIFDAGFRYADRRTRLAQAESTALDESLLRRSVAADVDTALVSLRAARETLRIADDAVAAAQRNVDETEILYRQGLARAIEVTDANQSRFVAEVTRESARLSMEQAYLDLRQALGYGPLDEEAK